MDLKTKERVSDAIRSAEERERRLDRMYHRGLQIMERAVAAITLLVLVAALILEIGRMFTVEGYFYDVEGYLHNILTIVVGMEFVRMLIDTTPANILEVLTLAITRHVILSHDDPLSNVACIACVAGLFAIRRFLIPREELKQEMKETE